MMFLQNSQYKNFNTMKQKKSWKHSPLPAIGKQRNEKAYLNRLGEYLFL